MSQTVYNAIITEEAGGYVAINLETDVASQGDTIPENPLEELHMKFSGREIWGDNPTTTIRKARDDWDD